MAARLPTPQHDATCVPPVANPYRYRAMEAADRCPRKIVGPCQLQFPSSPTDRGHTSVQTTTIEQPLAAATSASTPIRAPAATASDNSSIGSVVATRRRAVIPVQIADLQLPPALARAPLARLVHAARLQVRVWRVLLERGTLRAVSFVLACRRALEQGSRRRSRRKVRRGNRRRPRGEYVARCFVQVRLQRI
jgi:hypothetical protein